jgi:ribosomal protein S18 acetylase RimI-like enzyme
VIVRALVAADQRLLWDLLHVALWDPPPAPLRPRAILDHPEVLIYAEGWGRPGDVGVVGVNDDGRPIGGAWMRLIRHGEGLAYVDDETPQLGIAVLPEFQRLGHGEVLMRAALDAARGHGYGQVSLTVHPQNPAIALYERCGFRKVEDRRTYHLMLAVFRTPSRSR